MQGTSFAGPCNATGGLSAWWKVDIGEDHQVEFFALARVVKTAEETNVFVL